MSQTSTDPIADMLARIRNAIAINRSEIFLPHSNVKEAVSRILVETNFIDSVEVEGKTPEKMMRLRLAPEGSNARITEIVRLSKPGKRNYANSREIPVVKRGRGVVIISTSKGVMTGDKARTEKIGGELICKVY